MTDKNAPAPVCLPQTGAGAVGKGDIGLDLSPILISMKTAAVATAVTFLLGLLLAWGC